MASQVALCAIAILIGSDQVDLVPDNVDGPTIVLAEAHPGEPYGVGKVVFRLSSEAGLLRQTGAILLDDAEGRLLYPAMPERLLSKALGNNVPDLSQPQTIWFLFRGPVPPKVQLRGASTVTVEFPVRRARPRLARLAFQQWWRAYNSQARAQIAGGDYPPVMETYLTSMLGQRLNLRPPLLDRITEQKDNQLQQTLKLMLDVESVRTDAIRQLMQETPRSQQANLTLPAPNAWPPTSLPAHADNVAIEPIAFCVPEDCFYLRFGNWDNQLWLKRLMAEYGGDLSRMIQLRGHSSADPDKMLDQLALESSQIDDWFGGNLINDVAIIGHDFYMDDGPAIGVLMQAKSRLLKSNFSARRDAVAKNAATQEGGAGRATLTELEIAGEKVSFLSTGDNRIRSFYVVKGDFHLVTTSRKILEGFLRAADGSGSLGKNEEFRWARSVIPLERDDTVFAYLSSNFFQNLLSPHYQVILSRRNRGIAKVQMEQLASLAAANEGLQQFTTGDLITRGFLPPGFEISESESIQGTRGYFTPIPDLEINAITAWESARVSDLQASFAQELKRPDPIVIAIKRFDLGHDIERVVIDARMAPFVQDNLAWVGRVLGPAMSEEVAVGQDNLINLQASMGGLPILGNGEPHQIFAALQADIPPKTDLKSTNVFELFQLLKATPGYLGAWPKPGYLDILPALGGEPDEEGFTYSGILDLWRLQHAGFSVVSFDREQLERLRDHLAVVPADNPAQVRLQVGDVTESNLKDWANVMFYQRGWETSVANVRLLNAMIQQLGLPPELALEEAQRLLGVELVCPLGGTYKLFETQNGRVIWQSDKWPDHSDPQMPIDYTAPPMTWFRGATLNAYQLNTQFVVHASLDIQRQAAGRQSKLPSFDIFQGFRKAEELPSGPNADSGSRTKPRDKNE